MNKIEEIINSPIFFEKNRVWRVYTGGKLFSDFFGDNSEDSFYPEEWIASSVKAVNKESVDAKEGVSKIKGTDLFFDDLLKDYSKELLGDKKNFDILTKILDSAIRLPVQAHPDKAYSWKHFHSEYGKAEAWIVLATRPGASLYFGFKSLITKDEFKSAVIKSETDKTVMESLLNAIPVKAGDVFFVPAKMVHAIGKGCLILEFQEPTDFTIQPERWCGDYRLDEKEMFLGLDDDIALDVFDYSIFGEDAICKGVSIPKEISNKNGCQTEALITKSHTDCFQVQRHNIIQGSVPLNIAPAVYVVTKGKGSIIYNGIEKTIQKGDCFFLPYNLKSNSVITSNEELQVVFCFN